MANKFIKHYYYDEPMESTNPVRLEPDKTKSISDLSYDELRRMMERLRGERELESLIKDLKRNSGERDTYEQPFKIDTTTPIEQLYHQGIIGMKWGVRRYQNKDGTRTPAGKKRDEVQTKSDDHKESRQFKNMATEGLSNAELKKLNERLQLEETYKKLTAEKIEKSESFVAKAIAKGGQEALSEFSKGVMLGTAKVLVQQISPQFAEVAFSMKTQDKNKNKDKDNNKEKDKNKDDKK